MKENDDLLAGRRLADENRDERFYSIVGAGVKEGLSSTILEGKKNKNFMAEKKKRTKMKKENICLTVGGISTVRINGHALRISGDVQTAPALI